MTCLGICRYRTRAHDSARCSKCEIHDRSKVSVETQRAAGFADDLAVLAKEPGIAGGKNIRRRRRRSSDVAKAIDLATFHIDARKQRRRNACLAFFEQFVSLLATDDIARKENHTRRLQSCEQGTESRRHLGAVEADNEELANLGGN